MWRPKNSVPADDLGGIAGCHGHGASDEHVAHAVVTQHAGVRSPVVVAETAWRHGAGAVAAEAAKSGGLDVSGTDADFGGDGMNAPGVSSIGAAALASGWICKAPSVSQIAVGGDPDNPLLLGCKTLLRRVLTFMLTPGDLEAIAGAAIYTALGRSVHRAPFLQASRPSSNTLMTQSM